MENFIIENPEQYFIQKWETQLGQQTILDSNSLDSFESGMAWPS